MRLLEYRQDLFGRGYSVISGDMHYERMHEKECLPIRMFRRLRSDEEICTIFDDLVENIHFNWDTSKGTEGQYREKFANILLGKSPEWIIIAFQLTIGRVYLDLYNTKTSDTGSFHLVADQCGFDLRFEVPHADDRSCSVYDVSIEGVSPERNSARTTVTEYINNVRREIGFFHRNTDSDQTCGNWSGDSVYIEVTEYADL